MKDDLEKLMRQYAGLNKRILELTKLRRQVGADIKRIDRRRESAGEEKV